MNLLTSLLLLALGDGAEPPTEFRILSKGQNKTSKGTVVFDGQAEKLVLGAYADHGADLMIDYEHKSILKLGAPVDGGKAAGWFKPAVKNGELWATDVQWTESAKAALKAREYRYFSPALMHDSQGRVHKLVNVALTNLPATKNLQALVASESDFLGRNDPEWLAGYQSVQRGIRTAPHTSGSPPQKAPRMTHLKLTALAELARDRGLTTDDRIAAEQLTGEDLRVCYLMALSPSEFLAEKRRLQSLDAQQTTPSRDESLAQLQNVLVLSDDDRAAAVALTAEDLHVCRLTGSSPAAHLKMKRQLLQEDAQRASLT